MNTVTATFNTTVRQTTELFQHTEQNVSTKKWQKRLREKKLRGHYK